MNFEAAVKVLCDAGVEDQAGVSLPMIRRAVEWTCDKARGTEVGTIQ